MPNITHDANTAFESRYAAHLDIQRDESGMYKSSTTDAVWQSFLEGANWMHQRMEHKTPPSTLERVSVAALVPPRAAPTEAQANCTPQDGKADPLYATAVEIVRSNNKASISLIQRHLRIGYNYAARLLEAMEGTVVSTPDASGRREVLPCK